MRAGLQRPDVRARVREDMHGRGFTLVETPRFFGHDSLPGPRKGAHLRPDDRKGWRKFPGLAQYRGWLERILRDALPDEPLSLASLEFRHEAAGTEEDEVDRWHVDGSYLRTVFTLYGPATIYREGRAERSVPGGRTLVMTAMDRARALGVHCTLHRRPGAGPERAVLIGSFVPRPEDELTT